MDFVLDVHLGKLAKYLRMLGFDALWKSDITDGGIARMHRETGRIILTRDQRLFEENQVTGYQVVSTDPDEQLKEVMKRFDLAGSLRPFSICLECNHPIAAVEKARVLDRLPDNTAKYFDEFFLCENCGRVYWKGSHYDRMTALIKRILG